MYVVDEPESEENLIWKKILQYTMLNKNKISWNESVFVITYFNYIVLHIYCKCP